MPEESHPTGQQKDQHVARVSFLAHRRKLAPATSLKLSPVEIPKVGDPNVEVLCSFPCHITNQSFLSR